MVKSSAEEGAVVVGTDGSPGAYRAVVLALQEAALRKTGLRVVAVYKTDLVWASPYALPPGLVEEVGKGSRQKAAAQVKEAREDPTLAGIPGVAEVQVSVDLHLGDPAAHLVAATKKAELLVVGSRGRGATRSALLGSVALHCLTHAHCPVLVVKPMDHPHTHPPRVVVGVDGHKESQPALAVAVAEAGRRGAELEVLMAYEEGERWVVAEGGNLHRKMDFEQELKYSVQEMVADEVAPHQGEGAGQLSVQVKAVREPALDALIRESEGAHLLVVGSRSRGKLRGILLGSVALGVAMHAHCPVLVVRVSEAAE